MSKLFQIRIIGADFNNGLDAFVAAESKESATELFDKYRESEHFAFIVESVKSESGEDISSIFNNHELLECPGISVSEERNNKVIFSLGEDLSDWSVAE